MEEFSLSRELEKARWWNAQDDDKIRCSLCPRYCLIGEGKSGYCKVRTNINGELYSLSYGYPVALQIDPIEKKPLAEFLPGSYTFSLGTYGCNLGCVFCQNHHLARGAYPDHRTLDYVPPELIVDMAAKRDCKSVACTYNEPTVFAEYAIDIAREAKKAGLAMVLVSNGYITPDAAHDLYPLIDAANIDMKGFSEDFYRDMAGASLAPVLEAMEYFYSEGKHLEITNLIIPGKNDSPELIDAYLDWVESKLSKEVPLHFSAFHPAYHYFDSPRTEAASLHHIAKQVRARGFQHVYLGNI